MTSTIEKIDKQTGLLTPAQVISEQLTQVLSSLYMLEVLSISDEWKSLIRYQRDHLCEIRSYLEKHFEFKS